MGLLIIGQLQKIIANALNKTDHSIAAFFKDTSGNAVQPTCDLTSALRVSATLSGGANQVTIISPLGSNPASSCVSVSLATDQRLKGITTQLVISSQAVASAGSFTGSAITIVSQRAFSIQGDLSGASPSIALKYQVSADGASYFTPTAGGDIGTFTASFYESFAPPCCKFLKVISSNLGANTTSVSTIVIMDTM